MSAGRTAGTENKMDVKVTTEALIHPRPNVLEDHRMTSTEILKLVGRPIISRYTAAVRYQRSGEWES